MNFFTICFICFVQLWTQGCKPANGGPNEFETFLSTFGSGSNIVTRLVNQSGEVCMLLTYAAKFLRTSLSSIKS